MTMIKLGVADAKRRFSELIERVRNGERILIARRGKVVLALVPPEEVRQDELPAPSGLATIAGALEDWPELEELTEQIYADRRRAADREPPELD